MGRLEDMEIFARVVEAESFTGAAERLGLAKSLVSRRLNRLEERVGSSRVDLQACKLEYSIVSPK